MRLASTAAVPPGAWTYIFPPKIEGQHYEDLIDRVEGHVRAQGRVMSRAEVEVMVQEQICARWPQGCGANFNVGPAFIEGASRFVNTAKNFAESGGVVVDQETADRRSSTCVGCHNNVASIAQSSGCKACNKAIQALNDAAWWMAEKGIEALRPLVIGNRQSREHGKLGKCGICGCDNKTAVWIPNATFGLSEQDKLAFPSFCWKKE